MSISISGSTAMSGLSGMDTNFDTALEQLYSVEKTQLTQLQAWKSDWQLRYDAFNTVIDQMSAAKHMLSAIGNVNSFVSKNAASTDEKVLTALASGKATDGQHKITVSQMANNAIWCNTGAVFDSKTDIINTTGQTVTFSFDYAGKNYSYDIAPNTTLESFVSLINNSSKNPGITVSVINTGNGYVYQIAGKSTGESNSLTIYSCSLKGMDASQSTSVWSTNTGLDMQSSVTDPSKFTYTAELNSGRKVTVTLSGDATEDDLATALRNAAGTGLITTNVEAGGSLTINGVTSITRRSDKVDPYTPGGLFLNAGNDLSSALDSDNPSERFDVTITLNEQDSQGNNLTRTFSIDASKTKRDFVDQVKQALQSSASLGMDENGLYSIKLGGVAGISVSGSTQGDLSLEDLGFSSSTYAPSGTPDILSTSLLSSKTTLTFDQSKLAARIDGESEGEGTPLRYTLLKNDGSALYVETDVNGDPLKSSMSNQDLLNAVKKALGDDNPPIETTDSSGNVLLEINGVQKMFLSTGSATTAGFTTAVEASTQISSSSFFDTADEQGNPIRTLEQPPDLDYSIVLNDGSTRSFTLGSGASMQSIIDRIRTELADVDAEVSLVDSEGNAWIDQETSGDAYLHVSNIQSLTGSGFSGQVVQSSNWTITNSSNAIYQVDNWPMPMQSESNTITDLLDGVSLTLQGVGEANLTVSTDVASVETSIQNFLDAVNSVLMTIRDLTAVDEDKQITSNDPNDKGSSNYSKSTLTAEKGGLLTGNYGVQLVKTRFVSAVTGTPPGFQSMATADDLLSGDILSCLANMGIKTDTDNTSQTYGLFVISPSSTLLQQMDEDNYQDMINNHISELVDFFVSSGTGTSTSADFRYNSHIQGITEAGIYDVNYNVDSDGQITNVTIGGEPCQRDESRGGYYYTCSSGAARGLAISIDDLTEGDHSGQVRIKQGLVQTVESFLEKELTFNDVNISANAPESIVSAQLSLKSENGAMMTLKSNYAKIMENIDTSMDKEQRRLDTWYNRQKKVFSNLETLLRQLNDQQTSLESQLKQLSS